MDLKEHTVVMDSDTYLWYNSIGLDFIMDKEMFDFCKKILDYEILDNYGLVARSLEYVDEEK